MKPDGEARLGAAALRLAAKAGWESMTFERIAAAAKIPLAQAKKSFANTNELLPVIVRQMDAETRAKTGKINMSDTVHDRLFQAMMARFDSLQGHRAGILSILDAVRHDPALARLVVPAQLQSMQKLLGQTHAATKTRARIAAFGLLAVYYRALWCWRTDTSRDMSKTMAALDQSLRCAGRLAAILFRS